jgi:protein-disulfide isomerase
VISRLSIVILLVLGAGSALPGLAQTVQAGPLETPPDYSQAAKTAERFVRVLFDVPPILRVELTGLKLDGPPGFLRGKLEIGSANRGQSFTIHLSTDGRWLILDRLYDMTKDPFAETRERIAVDGVPSRGDPGSPVTVVEYSDFQCPFCSVAYHSIYQRLMNEYGERIRFIYKNFPLTEIHPWAQAAAIAAACAYRQGNQPFWKLHDFLFERQKEISAANLSEMVLNFARAQQWDVEKFRQCTEKRETESSVDAEQAEGNDVGVTGTPAFLINGRLISGLGDYSRLKRLIDSQLQASNNPKTQ